MKAGLRKNKKHTMKYLKEHSIDAVISEGKTVCPFCGGIPSKKLGYSVEEGTIVFYRQCDVCGNLIRVIYSDGME